MDGCLGGLDCELHDDVYSYVMNEVCAVYLVAPLMGQPVRFVDARKSLCSSIVTKSLSVYWGCFSFPYSLAVTAPGGCSNSWIKA